MILDEHSSYDFFDTMDSLLYYVNRKFDVVPDFDMEVTSALDETKAALIARTLWENSAVVEQFCSENPDHLPARLIDDARNWEYALMDVFTVVRYQDGKAVLMNDAGVFAVSGLTIDIDDVIGPAPAHVETTLVPYRGGVFYDGFLQAYDAEPDEVSAIQDEFEARVSREGVIATATDFVARAREYKQQAIDAEMDALLSGLAGDDSASPAEKTTDGYHKGAFADPGARERYEILYAIPKLVPLEFTFDTRFTSKNGHSPFAGDDVLAFRAAAACVICYGLISLGDAYDAYREVVDAPVSQTRFEKSLRMLEGKAETTYRMWESDGVDYLIHYTLSNRYVTEQVMAANMQQASAAAYAASNTADAHEAPVGASDMIAGFDAAVDAAQANAVAEVPSLGDIAAGDASRPPRSDASFVLDKQLQDVEAVRSALIYQHTEVSRKPLSRTAVEGAGPVEELHGAQTVRALQAFLDTHVPDGQDDYFFPRGVMDEILYAAIELSDMSIVGKYVEDLGLLDSTSDPDLLVRLVTNVFNSVPSWENFGWSAQELMENLTGRKIFFGPDGKMLKIGSNDPCPCGSGKPYRDCCGR